MPLRPARLTAVSLLAALTLTGCTHGSQSAGPSPSPRTASPTTNAGDGLHTVFTQFCVRLPHPLPDDKGLDVPLSMIPVNSYAVRGRCAGDNSTAIGTRFRIVFDRQLTPDEQQQVSSAVTSAYPDAQVDGGDTDGISVNFTVTPAPGSRLAAKPDGSAFGSFTDEQGKALSRILSVFEVTPGPDGPFQVGYTGAALTPAQQQQVIEIIASAAGVAPSEVHLRPKPVPTPNPTPSN